MGSDPQLSYLSGSDMIALERDRQIGQKGWTPQHDDGHDGAEIALAAACYALPPEAREQTILGRPLRLFLWPWGSSWKPGAAPYSHPERSDPDEQRVYELVKAGALIAAEIDRLLRRMQGCEQK